MGDFNLGNIQWIYEDKTLLPFNIKSDIESMVVDYFLSNDFHQLNSIANSLNRILDLAYITSDLKSVCEENLSPIISNSMHHKAITVTFEFYNYEKQNEESRRLDFSKADFSEINKYFENLNWSVLYSFQDPINIYEFIKTKFSKAVSDFVPYKSSLMKNKPPWFNSRLSRAKNAKNKAHKKFKDSNCELNRLRFIQLRDDFDTLHKFLYNQYIFKIESSLRSNPKSFWLYLNSLRKSSGFPSSMEFEGVKSNNTLESCNLFAKFFQNVFEIYSNGSSNNTFHLNSLHHNVIDDPVITAEDVLNAISQLKPSFNYEERNLPPIFFKRCQEHLAKPIAFLFNSCLSNGIFLDDWKICSIDPIFKSGIRNDVTNYRAIVKQSAIAKLFDFIIKNKLFHIVKDNITDYQHGFLPGKSTSTNLALITNSIVNAMENGSQLDVVYTDFSKAFDKVDHNILLNKLKNFGVPQGFLNFLYSYLKNRKLFVKIGSIYSETVVNATSGIPQGTHCGPLLFLIFINDLPHIFKYAECLMFADDVKLYLKISTSSDCLNLQSDITNFHDWCLQNSMQLNINKCCVISYSKRINYTTFDYFISNSLLVRKVEMKDLGVIFDTRLNFKSHYDYIISRANSMLGFIKRNTQNFNDPLTIKSLFISLVRSILDYCSVIWNPYYNEHSLRIERVQKNFTRYAIKKLHWPGDLPPYDVRRKLLGMQCLKDRRVVYDLIFVYNVLHCNIQCSELSSLFVLYQAPRSLRHTRMLVPNFHRTNYAINEPITRCINLCNTYCSILEFDCSKPNFLLNLFKIFN